MQELRLAHVGVGQSPAVTKLLRTHSSSNQRVDLVFVGWLPAQASHDHNPTRRNKLLINCTWCHNLVVPCCLLLLAMQPKKMLRPGADAVRVCRRLHGQQSGAWAHANVQCCF